MEPEAYGALVYTLLDGTALKAVESIEIEDLDTAGGEELIFELLDGRYPEQTVQDKLGEVLDAVFGLKVDKGERTPVYVGRAKEAFDRAAREGVNFPSVARGFLLLRGARLSPERRAVVLSAAHRSYEEQEVSAAMRQTYPQYLHDPRTPINFAEAAEDMNEPEEDYEEQEIDALIAGTFEAAEEDDVIEESDAIDVLVTWKQQRQANNAVKNSRGFPPGQPPARPDVGALRRRVRCFKCKEVGHFSRDCPQNQRGKSTGYPSRGPGRGKGDARQTGSASSASSSAAGSGVPVFAVTCGHQGRHEVLLAWNQAGLDGVETVADKLLCDVNFVHDAGAGITDTGCGRGVVGQETLERHLERLGVEAERAEWEENPEQITFRYGNGQTDKSLGRCRVPCCIKNKHFFIAFCVVPGKVPMLIAKETLKKMGAVIDLGADTIYLRALAVQSDLTDNQWGNYQLDLWETTAGFPRGRVGALKP